MYLVQELCTIFIRISKYVLPTSSLRERTELTTEWSTRCQNIANCCAVCPTRNICWNLLTHIPIPPIPTFPKVWWPSYSPATEVRDRSKSTNQEQSSCLCQCWNVDAVLRLFQFIGRCRILDSLSALTLDIYKSVSRIRNFLELILRGASDGTRTVLHYRYWSTVKLVQ